MLCCLLFCLSLHLLQAQSVISPRLRELLAPEPFHTGTTQSRLMATFCLGLAGPAAEQSVALSPEKQLNMGLKGASVKQR